MVKQAIIGLLMIIVSTLCYYIPAYFASYKGIEVETIPKPLLVHYIFKLSGAFLLTAAYAISAFILCNPKLLVLKLILCWLAIAETLTFINDLIVKIYGFSWFNEYQIAATAIIFICFCSFFVWRALFKPKSEEFDPLKTYIVNFLPKDVYGVINYLINHSGHKGIYQDGKVYAFKKRTGRVEVENIENIKENVALKSIKRIHNIDRIVGKQFSAIKYNCNTMVKDATRN